LAQRYSWRNMASRRLTKKQLPRENCAFGGGRPIQT
jgi:hypothetical protein